MDTRKCTHTLTIKMNKSDFYGDKSKLPCACITHLCTILSPFWKCQAESWPLPFTMDKDRKKVEFPWERAATIYQLQGKEIDLGNLGACHSRRVVTLEVIWLQQEEKTCQSRVVCILRMKELGAWENTEDRAYAQTHRWSKWRGVRIGIRRRKSALEERMCDEKYNQVLKMLSKFAPQPTNTYM